MRTPLLVLLAAAACTDPESDECEDCVGSVVTKWTIHAGDGSVLPCPVPTTRVVFVSSSGQLTSDVYDCADLQGESPFLDGGFHEVKVLLVDAQGGVVDEEITTVQVPILGQRATITVDFVR